MKQRKDLSVDVVLSECLVPVTNPAVLVLDFFICFCWVGCADHAELYLILQCLVMLMTLHT